MREQPRHLLVGQMETALTVSPSGPVLMLGARFTATGLRRLLPMPQDRLAGQLISLDTVWNRWTRQTADQIASASDPAGQLHAFERALELLLPAQHAERCDRGVDAVVRAMRARRGPLPIPQLAAIAGISRRQLERRFRACVGLPPNLYGRIVRFQHAFTALTSESGASVAARLGFVDQAHLVHEVRRFSGHTPTLLAEAEGLTAFFASGA